MWFAEQEGRVFQYQDGSATGSLPWQLSQWLTRNLYCGYSVSHSYFPPSYLLHRSYIDTLPLHLFPWWSSTNVQQTPYLHDEFKRTLWAIGTLLGRGKGWGLGKSQLKPSHCSCLRQCHHYASLDSRYHYPCLGAEWLSLLEGDRLLWRWFCFQLEGVQGLGTDLLDKLVAPVTKVQVLQAGWLWRQFQLLASTFVHHFTSPPYLSSGLSYSI